MLFRNETLQAIARGEVTLAFRRWKRPTVKPGSRLRTGAGVVRIASIEVCDVAALSGPDATAAGFPDIAALHEMLGPENGDRIYRIALDGIEPDARVARRQQAEPSDAEWSELHDRFARWAKARPGYFPSILKAIADRPAVLAATLARLLGMEKLKFKQDVRKLKELGLTESLEIGYRLSPRGEVVLKWLEEGL